MTINDNSTFSESMLHLLGPRAKRAFPTSKAKAFMESQRGDKVSY